MSEPRADAVPAVRPAEVWDGPTTELLQAITAGAAAADAAAVRDALTSLDGLVRAKAGGITALADTVATVAEQLIATISTFPADESIAASCSYLLKCLTGILDAPTKESQSLSKDEFTHRMRCGRLPLEGIGKCRWRLVPGLADALIAVLERHGSSNVVAEEACHALINIFVDPAAAESVDKPHAIAAILATLSPRGASGAAAGGAGSGVVAGSSSISDSRKKVVAQPACALLRFLAIATPPPTVDVQLQILRVMAVAARCHEADGEIVSFYCSALNTLVPRTPTLLDTPELSDTGATLARLLTRKCGAYLAVCRPLHIVLQNAAQVARVAAEPGLPALLLDLWKQYEMREMQEAVYVVGCLAALTVMPFIRDKLLYYVPAAPAKGTGKGKGGRGGAAAESEPTLDEEGFALVVNQLYRATRTLLDRDATAAAVLVGHLALREQYAKYFVKRSHGAFRTIQLVGQTDSAAVAVAACTALQNMAAHRSCRGDLAVQAGRASAAILMATLKNKDSAAVAAAGCATLHDFTSLPGAIPGPKELLGFIRIITTVLRFHVRDAGVGRAAMTALAALSSTLAGCAVIHADGGVALAAEAMTANPDDAQLAAAACTVLQNVCASASHEELLQMVEKFNADVALAGALARHSSDARIAAAATAALERLRAVAPSAIRSVAAEPAALSGGGC